jgi:hypothetical protein
MVNYNKSSIYKLCCKDVNIKEEYIGSTTRFERRKAEHKSLSKNLNNNFYVYQFIRENGGIENWDMIQIEEVNVNNKRELETRERYWIETLKAVLNNNIPSRTHLESKKIYKENNREVIAEKQKIYKENNREVIAEKCAKYYENNREAILEKTKIYYENNKEIILEKKKEKVKCDCGSDISQSSFTRHLKSKKHLKVNIY